MSTVSVVLDGFGIGTNQGILGLCSLVLVEGRQRTLIDVGHAGRRVAAREALAQRGLSPTDIDAVVLTHAHWDHVQNLDVFPAARILLHPAERRYAERPHRDDWATPDWTGAMLGHYADRIVEVEDGQQIEPGVTVVHTPGHSVGSISVLVETAQGPVVVAGDALQFASVAQTGQNPIVFCDDQLARASIRRIVEIADVVYPGHDRPFRRTSDGGIEYQRPFDLALSGIAPTAAGLRFEDVPRPPFVLRQSVRASSHDGTGT